ncbi:MAG: hypothetical protein ACREK5_02220 [Gemmatimonadota bacterium]
MNRGKCSLCGVVCLCVGIACAAPISTQRSPMHLRIIELSNDTDRELVFAIEPTADQHLTGPTTFTGRFRPGQRKTLYLYHGLSYQVDVLEPDGAPVARGIFQVDHDLGLAFGGDSLEAATRIAVRLGGPTVILADSLRRSVPFGTASQQSSDARGTASRRRGGQP